MKKLLLASIILFSCSKQPDQVHPIKRNLIPEVCVMGISSTSNLRKHKPLPLPQPVVDTTTVAITTDTTYGVLLLNFNGQIVSSPVWNNGTAFYCNLAGLNSTQISDIISGVAQDYYAYRVIVTTNEAIYYAAHINKRMRQIVTSTSAWYTGVSGVSYTGSLFWGDNTPCFVFTDRLGYNTHMVAQICSHEFGHTIGLSHQARWSSTCFLLETYNTGDGVNAPLMGNSLYATNGGSWWYGQTPVACNNYQDDAGILRNKLRLK